MFAADPLDSGGNATRALRRSGLGFLPNGAIRRTKVERANHRVITTVWWRRFFEAGQRGCQQADLPSVPASKKPTRDGRAHGLGNAIATLWADRGDLPSPRRGKELNLRMPSLSPCERFAEPLPLGHAALPLTK